MHFSTVVSFGALLFTVVNAQTTTDTKCNAQNILDTCVKQFKPQVEACSTTDYSCSCQGYTNLLTCYNNCPDDQTRFSIDQQKSLFCGYVSIYASTSTPAARAPASSGAPSANDVSASVISAPAAASSAASAINSAVSSAASAVKSGTSTKPSINGTGPAATSSPNSGSSSLIPLGGLSLLLSGVMALALL